MLAVACEGNQKFSTALEPGSCYCGESHREYPKSRQHFQELYIMEPVTIPISICPHFSQGKPRGHYLLAKRLFIGEDQPILVKQQYVGFNGFLFVTVVRPNSWTTTFKTAIKIPRLDDRKIIWLGTVPLYGLKGGFKVYLPETILKAKKPGRIEGVGIFRKYQAPGFSCYYLEIPKLSAEILSGKEELK